MTDGAVPAPSLAERRKRIESAPLPASIGALLDDVADAVPDRLAWNFFEGGERAVYREVRAAVNRLANGLRALGVTKGTHVAVMLPNLAAMPTTWLALARLGAVMVPINIHYTARELAWVLANSDARWLVVHAECLGTLAGVAALPPRLARERVLVVDGGGRSGYREWAAVAAGQPETFRATDAVALDDLMNVQYTSGTTGFPKGCLLTHRYWLVLARVQGDHDGRTYERIMAANPFFYMTPQWLLLTAFYHRATLSVARRLSGSRYIGWIREHRIQFCLFPEAAWKQPPSPRDRDNEIVRVSTYGFSRHDHADLERRFGFVAREAFGMTEIGAGMFVPIEATDMVGSGSCGLAEPFRECRVADEAGRTLPPGEIGELLIRGPGIFQGYYENPEATARAFHGDWFRTGDLFRCDERGYFYIVGRLKDMIRRSGENIAAREVEEVLLGLPEIVEAACVPVPDPDRGEEVKAYVVLRAGLSAADLPPERIVAHCARLLAPFKVPRFIAYRDALPRTGSNKVAKAILAGEADLRAGYDRLAAATR